MNVSTLTSAILATMPDMNKCQRDFFTHILETYLTMRGRHNFLNMERYGKLNELTYRNHFSKSFDFEHFNYELIKGYCGKALAVAFDPSHISKSGRKTPGVGYFWSGCAQKNKWGLEVCGFAAIDMENHTAMHYSACQTLPEAGQSLMSFYCELLKEKADSLKKVSKTLLVDAYFSKKPFVDTAICCGMDVVSRLRDDAVLFYLPPPPKPNQRGRPPQKGGRVNTHKVDTTQLQMIAQSTEQRTYTGVLICQSLERKILVNIVQELRADGSIKAAKIFFSTNIQTSPADIHPTYKGRFQIEFLYRDAKQHTGLEHCQSRKTEALEFHFNLSLTAVSVAKAIHHLSIEKDNRGPFSMTDIKCRYFNELIVNAIFTVFAKSPNPTINHPEIQTILNLGKIAA
jgi:hypothetical protein